MLQLQQKEMGVVAPLPVKQNWKTIAKEKLHFDVDECPCCKKGIMQTILDFEANAPPEWVLQKIAAQQRSASRVQTKTTA